jgi:SnoaL-like polyketide cyclase
MKTHCLTYVALLGLAACTANIPLTDSKLESIHDRPLHAMHREPPILNKQTAGRSLATTPLGLFGILGVMTDVIASSAAVTAGGQAVVKEFKIEDPAILIKNRLAGNLRNVHGFSDVRVVEAPQSRELKEPKAFQAVVPEGGIVLDVWTESWAISFLPAKWNRYRIYYVGKARLLDPWSGKLLASAKAKFLEEYEENSSAPSHDELLANDAALLKAKLQQAAQQVAGELSVAMFPASGARDMKSFAARYTAAWCSQDPASVAAFYAENGSLKINDAAPSVGRAALTEAAHAFMRDFPDMVVEMNALERAGAGYIYRWTLTGTNTGPGGKGNKLRISGYEEWTIGADGLIASSLGHFDAADYQRQIDGL